MTALPNTTGFLCRVPCAREGPFSESKHVCHLTLQVIRSLNWHVSCVLPYRTMEEVIDGVVITFSDITAAKALEAGLREEIARLEKLVAAGSSL